MYEPQQFIPLADLNADELDELVEDGSVNLGGHVYAAWRSDHTGPWLKLIGAAKPESKMEPADDREYPEIHGTPDVPGWLQRGWNAFLGRDGEGEDVE